MSRYGVKMADVWALVAGVFAMVLGGFILNGQVGGASPATSTIGSLGLLEGMALGTVLLGGLRRLLT